MTSYTHNIDRKINNLTKMINLNAFRKSEPAKYASKAFKSHKLQHSYIKLVQTC